MSQTKICLIQCLLLNKVVYLIGVWLGVNLRTIVKNIYVLQSDWTMCSTCVIILEAIVNKLGGEDI